MPEYIPKRSRIRGLRLAARKQSTTSRAIGRPFIPERLYVPLESYDDRRPELCVRAGTRVFKGDTIAHGSDTAPDVHASTSGRVGGVESHAVVTGGKLREAPCVVIESDGRDEAGARPVAPDDPAGRLERIRRAGIVGLGGAAFATGRKIALTQPCKTVVINGAECEPYISCDDMLMRERAADVVAGSLALCDLAAAEACIIAIERDKPQAILAIREAVNIAADARLGIAELPSVYPAGGERQLIDLLAAREVPSGAFPSNIGFLCQNVGTAYAVHRALAHGEPVISRVVTLTGAGVAESQNVEVLIGTRIEDLIRHCGGYTAQADRLIVGGSMMGISLPTDDSPVTKSTNCIIVAAREELPVPRQEWPCIRCGECSLICPAYLLPQRLLTAARNRDHEGLLGLGLHDCIECGCCDAVCPSHIPLTETFRDAKRELEAWTERSSLSQQSQRRYEARRDRRERDRHSEREEQSRLIGDLGDDKQERERSILEAVERSRRRRNSPDERT